MLTVTEMLRKKGVVDKFVEFFGDGLANLPLADRATIANMAPEYGSTCGIFPIDEETLRYLELSGRPARADRAGRGVCEGAGHVARERPAARATTPTCWSWISPRSSRASPARSRPQDRVPLRTAKTVYRAAAKKMADERTQKNPAATGKAAVNPRAADFELKDGAVLIAAITSCTNTSNPAVMIGAGLLARNARERGLKAKPWVKTSLAPGSRVVTDYLEKAGLPTTSRPSASTRSAMAAPPASATPGR